MIKLLLLLVLVLVPAVSYAQPTGLDDLRGVVGGPPINSLADARGNLINIVDWFIMFFWVVAVAMVMWAAFLYLTGGDNEDKIKEAKKRLLYAMIAAAIALLATGIDVIVLEILRGQTT